MGPKPSPKHSLERLKGSEDYSPENCTWATVKEQCNNRKSNVNITFRGETKNVTQWVADLGIPRKSIHNIYERLRRGWTAEEALTRPPRVIG